MIRPAEFKIARCNARTGVTLSVAGELDLSTVPLLEQSVTAPNLESAAIVSRTTGADAALPFADPPDR